MVLNEAFVDVAQRIDVDKIHPFPMRSLVELTSGKETFFQAYTRLREAIRAVEGQGGYDFVFNLTPSRSASFFASLIAHEARAGTWVGKDGSFLAVDPWAAYLVAMTANRRTNPFHLIDIWLGQIGQRGPGKVYMSLTAEDQCRADALLADCGIHLDRDLLLGFQVSASQREKCWSEKEFIRLGQNLQQSLQARVLLFGVAGEEALCQRICAHVPGSVNLAGKTDVGRLAGALKRCRVLVTNDTGTQHVATAVGTKVVVISVGPVFFRETGPYGEGHLVFQARLPCAPCSFNGSCLNPVCKEKIRADMVYRALVRVLQGEDGLLADLPEDVSCYRSGFDEDGRLTFSTLRPTDEEDRLQANRGFWHGLLEGRSTSPRAPMPASLDTETVVGWSRLSDLLTRSSALVQKIRRASENDSNASLRLRVLSGNLSDTEQEMRHLAKETIEMAPLVHYLLLRREALSTRDPFRFLRETASLYSQAAEQICQWFELPIPGKEAMSHG
jgi:ADP-heptose:LPS heptosyltransferase